MTSAAARIQVSIASDHAASREVQRRILEEIRRRNYCSDAVFAIKLSLEEAMVNAIKHGNHEAPDKQVHVTAVITDRQAELAVEDEGPGFDRKSVPDPTRPEYIERCCGRGILLIESYMDSVRWSHKGRRIQMVKKNRPTSPLNR